MGSGTKLKQQAKAKTAHRLSLQGLTHKAIAEQLQINSEQVKTLIKLGERLNSLEES
jgi:DNA-binding CsgD family transcriptional regulator